MAAFPVRDTGLAPDDQRVLRASVSAYLGRYRGETRLHTESDLRVFLHWCTDHDLDPLAAVQVDIGTVPALAARRAPVAALNGFSPAVGGSRLLPGLRHRPDPAALTRRLRPAAHRAGGVTHAGL